jgi:hypothetical protein
MLSLTINQVLQAEQWTIDHPYRLYVIRDGDTTLYVGLSRVRICFWFYGHLIPFLDMSPLAACSPLRENTREKTHWDKGVLL